jgi:hypothetical protein
MEAHRIDTRTGSRAVRLLVCLLIAGSFLAVGCTVESQPTKKTLFDHDHETPDHWPSDLSDLAAKMRDRLGGIGQSAESSGRDEAAAELADLVAWAPEIAADTDMTEAEWVPIYEASEMIDSRLKDSGGNWTPPLRRRASELCDLLERLDHD